MTIIATLLIIALVIVLTYTGLRDGAFFTTYALMRNFFAFLCAMTFCEPMARLLAALITDAYPAYDYFRVASFAFIFGLIFALGRTLKMKYTTPQVPCFTLLDTLAGPVAGLLSGVVLTGTILIFLTMLPFMKFLPKDFGRIDIHSRRLDTGAAMLRFYSFAAGHMGGGGEFLLDPEPIVADFNNNQRVDEGESSMDLNGNGQWDRGWMWHYKHNATITPEDLAPLPGVLNASPQPPSRAGRP